MIDPTEQTEEFSDYGLRTDADKKRVLRRVMTLFISLISLSIGLNIYQAKRADKRSDVAVDREERHKNEIKDLQNQHALEIRDLSGKYNTVFLEMFKQLMNNKLKIDTTLKNQ